MVIIQFIYWFSNLLHGTNFSLSVPDEFWSTIQSVISFVAYFIPLQPIITIIELSLALMAVRVLISILITLWRVLPIV